MSYGKAPYHAIESSVIQSSTIESSTIKSSAIKKVPSKKATDKEAASKKASPREALSATEAAERLRVLSGWTRNGAAITRTFEYRDFSAAFAFMVRVALIAERLDHHPDWSNTYGKVVISLTTHVAGGLTDLDFKMATAIDGLIS